MTPLSRREWLALSSGMVFAGAAYSEAPKLRISLFSQEVTPPIGHPCMGGGIAPVKEILDPLYAHGIILQGLEKPVVIVAVDWCEIRNDAYDAWREAIAEAVGTTRERVLVSALHQHDTPIADLTAQKLLEENGAKGKICDLAFHEKIVQAVARSAKASLKQSRAITHLGVGQSEVSQVASNRRYLDADGKVRYNRMSATGDAKIRDAEVGTIDPQLKTLSFWEDDRPIVSISAYATHPMSFYGRGGVSSDFVGHARQKRQKDELDCLQIYLSGCSGNVTAGKYNDGAVTNRPVLADRIYEAMKAAWKATKKQPITKCEFRTVPLQLEARDSPEFKPEAMLKQLKESQRPFAQCLAALGLSWRKRVEAKQPIDLAALDFGSSVYLLMPAESYVEYQLFAQTVRPNDFVLVAGYGESGPGYIPIERAWKENDSNLSDWCWVNPGSEKRMQEAITRVLQIER